MTIMTTTFIPCGAKVPFIAMIAGALFGGSAWVATSAYFIGMAAIIISGIMLKKTKMFAGEPAPFVMELPGLPPGPPSATFCAACGSAAGRFIKKAGTIILLSTIFVWFTTYFGFVDGAFRMLDEERNRLLHPRPPSAPRLRGSSHRSAGATGRQLVASITGLVAKENIVGTLGILYGGGDGTVYQDHRQCLQRHHRLFVPGVQPAVRSLLRGHRRHQARDEQRQVDLVRHRLSVRLCLHHRADDQPVRRSVHRTTSTCSA